MSPDTDDLATRGEDQARRAESSTLADHLARAGLFARAMVYLVIAYLTVDVAVFRTHRPADSAAGALQEVARQPAGGPLLTILALGLAAYAIWRLLQAAAGTVGATAPLLRLVQRIGVAGAGVFYGALCVRAATLVAGGHQHHRSHNPASLSATILGWTGGRVLLTAIGVGILAASLGFTAWAARQGFLGALRMRAMPAGIAVAVQVAGTFGQVVRGLVAAAIGAFVLVAAARDAPHQAKGLDATVRTLANQPYGPWLLGVIAAGFVGFAVLSLVEVPYGRT